MRTARLNRARSLHIVPNLSLCQRSRPPTLPWAKLELFDPPAKNLTQTNWPRISVRLKLLVIFLNAPEVARLRGLRRSNQFALRPCGNPVDRRSRWVCIDGSSWPRGWIIATRPRHGCGLIFASYSSHVALCGPPQLPILLRCQPQIATAPARSLLRAPTSGQLSDL